MRFLERSRGDMVGERLEHGLDGTLAYVRSDPDWEIPASRRGGFQRWSSANDLPQRFLAHQATSQPKVMVSLSLCGLAPASICHISRRGGASSWSASDGPLELLGAREGGTVHAAGSPRCGGLFRWCVASPAGPWFLPHGAPGVVLS